MRNTGGVGLSGPAYVFFTTLPAGVTLPTLPTSGGLPYLVIPSSLQVGATSIPVAITVTDSTNARIAYTTKRYVVANKLNFRFNSGVRQH